MLSKLQIFILAGFGLLLTIMVMVIVTQYRENEISDFLVNRQKELLTNTSTIISQYIGKQRVNLNSFVAHNHQLLRHLRAYPQDTRAYTQLQQRMRLVFPNYLNFTIVDENGNPIWIDFEAKVGAVCRTEINHFSKEALLSGIKAKNSILIHPNINQHHYDLMALLNLRPGVNNIFFVSFSPAGLANIIKSQQILGHHLMLVKKDDTALIEVTEDGARDKIKRDFRLSEKELLMVKTFEDVKGTGWRIIDLLDSEFLNAYRQTLWKRDVGTALMVLILGLFMLAFSIRLLARKKQ